MSTRTPPRLGPRGRRLWRRVTERYDLTAGELEVLLDACRVADLVDALTTAATDAPVLADGRVNPVIRELRAQRDLLGRLLARLALPDEDDEVGTAASRLGRLGGRARARRAQKQGGA